MTIALPWSASELQQLIDLGLGADVDAARRLVEEQDIAIARQPFGDDHLLLIAAGQQFHLLIGGGRADVEQPDEFLHRARAMSRFFKKTRSERNWPRLAITTLA